MDSFWCAAAPWEFPLLAVSAGLLVLGIGAGVFLRRHRALLRETPYVLPFSPNHSDRVQPRPAFPSGPLSVSAVPPSPEVRVARAPHDGERAPPPSFEDPPQDLGGLRQSEPSTLPRALGASPPPADPHYADDPLDHTLQLLPGRLEVERGPGTGSEIRFVRLPGPIQEITLGRSDGPPHRHIRLDSPTVSRQHARLIFADGGWVLRNESSTNPTVHNGRPIHFLAEETTLGDGDRIELGEVALLFRQEPVRDRLATRSSWYTDRGRRALNQDAAMIRTLPDGRELAVVCDGMGSHSAGGVASHLALDELVRTLSDGSPLGDAVRAANRAVHEAASRDPERHGMATTLVAALRGRGALEVANVGDSRAYALDAAGIRQLTRDHSFVAEMVLEGGLSHEEAIRSPWRNAITRSLGPEEEVEVDVFREEEGGRTFLLILCSDGIHGVLPPEEILELAAETPDVRDLARALGERALVRGGEDNVAAAVMAVGEFALSLPRR